MKPVEERFWSKVDKRGPDECWPWLAGFFGNGYGGFQNVNAHRFAYELTHGSISGEFHVCHKCDNKKCCNPNHLFLGTNADNRRDMVEKGRQSKGRSHGVKNRGTLHARSKLTEQQVLSIFHEKGKQQDIADKYGIDQTCVSNIKLKKRWGWLLDKEGVVS